MLKYYSKTSFIHAASPDAGSCMHSVHDVGRTVRFREAKEHAGK